MAAPTTELLCYRGITTSPTLSKTLSLLSSPFQIPKSLSSPIPRAPSLSLHTCLPSLPRFLSRFSTKDFNISITDDQEEDGEEEEEEEVGELVDESDGVDDLSMVYADDLEEDARYVVQEFSSSLSSQLRIEDEKDSQEEVGRKQRRHKSTVKSIPDHLLPRVAIVGRPNVGKSALFNRLVSGNKAIVVDEPGVTRDRLYGRSFWGDHEFMVVDTGGVLTVSKSQASVMEELAISTTIGMDGIPLASREAAVARMPSMIEKQATAAVEESSVIIFLVDGKAGLTAADEEISDWLRKNYSDKYIILAVNKCESPRKGSCKHQSFGRFHHFLYLLYLELEPGELLDLVCSGLKNIEDPEDFAEQEDYVPAIAIVGRPNDRTIVSPVSGTTRDAIDIEFIGPDGQKFRLIDTAGIRRRAVVASSGSMTEALSVNRAFRAIRRSDVVALVIEALACITEQVSGLFSIRIPMILQNVPASYMLPNQATTLLYINIQSDCKIAERIEREGKGCLIVVNKWDTIPNKNQQTATYYEQDVREKLRVLGWAPIVYSTAIAGQSVD
ncbi:GTP-binding family protein, partial [Prunus dulcis]